MDVTKALKRFERAATERRRLEPTYDDAIRLTMPGRKRFNQSNVIYTDDIFDETGANSLSEFVSRIYAGLTPPFSQFIKLECSSIVDQKSVKAVNDDLALVGEFLFEEVWGSNFAQEFTEALHDMAINQGVLLVEDGAYGQSLHHKAISMTEAYVELGADGRIGGFFRKRDGVLITDLEEAYPGCTLSPEMLRKAERDAEAKVCVIEYTRNLPGRVEKCEYTVIIKDHKQVILTRTMTGEGCNPFIIFRWSTTAGEANGRGPLMNALAAIRTTNLMVELVMENAAMSVVGMYQTDNDSTVNSDQVTLLPGSIIAKEVGTKGLEPIEGPTGNFNMKDVVLSDQRLNIKRALFNDMLADPGKTPATAYEVSERMADLAYRTAGSFSRLYFEFLLKYVKRVIYILTQRGDIALPVKDGRAIKYRAVSPLALAQSSKAVQGFLQLHQMLTLLIGPQAAAASYKMEVLLPWLREQTGADERLFKSVEEMVKAVAQASAAMAQAQQGIQQGAPQGAPTGAPIQ